MGRDEVWKVGCCSKPARRHPAATSTGRGEGRHPHLPAPPARSPSAHGISELRPSAPPTHSSTVALELSEASRTSLSSEWLGLGVAWENVNSPQISTSPSSHPQQTHIREDGVPVLQLRDEPQPSLPARPPTPSLSWLSLPAGLVQGVGLGWGPLSQTTPECFGEPGPAHGCSCPEVVVVMVATWDHCPFPPASSQTHCVRASEGTVCPLLVAGNSQEAAPGRNSSTGDGGGEGAGLNRAGHCPRCLSQRRGACGPSRPSPRQGPRMCAFDLPSKCCLA